MKRLAGLLLRRTTFILALLMGCVIAMGMGLNSLRPVQQSGGGSLLLPLGAAAVLIGWGLARSRLRAGSTAFLAVVSGVATIALSVGRLAMPLAGFLAGLFSLGMALVRLLIDWLAGNPLPAESLSTTWQATILAGQTLGQAAATLSERAISWATALLNGKANTDPLGAALGWCLVIWLCAIWLSWATRRMENPLAGITPTGLLLAAVFNYTGLNPFPLALLVGCGLALMALVRFDRRERRWLQQGIDFPEEIRMDLAIVAIPLVLLLFALAAITPPLSIRSITDLAHHLTQRGNPQDNTVAESLGLENETPVPTAVVDPLRQGGLPRRHLLGSGAELSQRVVMVVKVLSPAWPLDKASPEPRQPPPQYYWRALTYDTYTTLGWYSTYQQTSHYVAGQSLLPAVPGNMQVIEQEVSAVEDLGGLLYSAGTLLRVDQPYEVSWRNLPTFSPEFPVAAMNADLFSLMDLFGTRTAAKIYRATSALPLYSVEQLRSVSGEYPQWVVQGYLQLPDSLPERVRRLALDLTATRPNAYDRAAAIEAYLRAIPYTLDIGQPPPRRDVTDYYLFDLKKGYCDYAATAMVVLSRAAGVPARLVIGYAGGVYDAGKGYYVVSEADAHSWAEVFFPGVGWVEFEPTGGRPEIERSTQATPRQIPPFELPKPEVHAGPTLAQRLSGYALLGSMGLVLLGVLLALGLAAGAWVERQVLARRPAGEVIVRLYRRMAAQGKRLVPSAPRGVTPFELAGHLEERLNSLGAHFTLLPASIHLLTDLYTRAVYSSHSLGNDERQQALQAWSNLRWRLWTARLSEKTHRRKKRL